jgi:hypothetical protein
MFRDGLLSPRSKLFASTRSSSSLSEARPMSNASQTSLASMMTQDSTMTKSGLYKDCRDTARRRTRHRDGRLLRGGIGLTTGLGWSDSEDEDAPSPLTRRLSAAQIAKRAERAKSPLGADGAARRSNRDSGSTVDRDSVLSAPAGSAAHVLRKTDSVRSIWSAPDLDGLPTPAASPATSPVLRPVAGPAHVTRTRTESTTSIASSAAARERTESNASTASSLRGAASVGNLTPRRDLPVSATVRKPGPTRGIPRKTSAIAIALRSPALARSASSSNSVSTPPPASRARTMSAAPAPTLSGPTTRALAVSNPATPAKRADLYTRLPTAPRPLHLSALALGPPAISVEPSTPPAALARFSDVSASAPRVLAYNRNTHDRQRALAAQVADAAGGPRPRTGTGMAYRRTSGGYTGGLSQPSTPPATRVLGGIAF